MKNCGVKNDDVPSFMFLLFELFYSELVVIGGMKNVKK